MRRKISPIMLVMLGLIAMLSITITMTVIEVNKTADTIKDTHDSNYKTENIESSNLKPN